MIGHSTSAKVRFVFPLCAAFGAACLAFAGCSSSTNEAAGAGPGSSVDGSSEQQDGAGKDASLDAAPDNIAEGPCSYAGGNTFCQGQAAFCKRCPDILTECEKESILSCEDFSSPWSEAARKARVDCLAEAECDRSVLTNNACLQAKMAVATPSAAQSAMADHYCTRCEPGDMAGCKSGFYKRSPLGPASFVLDYNDTIIEKIDQICVITPVECGLFAPCAKSILDAELPPLPDPCADAG